MLPCRPPPASQVTACGSTSAAGLHRRPTTLRWTRDTHGPRVQLVGIEWRPAMTHERPWPGALSSRAACSLPGTNALGHGGNRRSRLLPLGNFRLKQWATILLVERLAVSTEPGRQHPTSDVRSFVAVIAPAEV